MKNLLKIEEIGFFVLGIWAFGTLGLSWWWFLGCLFLPDISMVGYVFNTKTGAWLYNLAHHRVVALGAWGIGYFNDWAWWTFAGVILFTHIALDRVFGYGLKHETDFKHTHLGNL